MTSFIVPPGVRQHDSQGDKAENKEEEGDESKVEQDILNAGIAFLPGIINNGEPGFRISFARLSGCINCISAYHKVEVEVHQLPF